MCHIKRILLACQSNYLQTYSKPIMSAAGTLLCWAWKTTFCYAFHFVNLLKFINMHNVRDKTNMCGFYNIKMAVRGIITVSILFYCLFVVTMQILFGKNTYCIFEGHLVKTHMILKLHTLQHFRRSPSKRPR